MADHLDVQLAHQLLSGELDEETRARWMAHAETCPRCGELLANERTMLAVLKLGSDESAPDAHAGLDRILDRMDRAGAGAAAYYRRTVGQTIVAGVITLGLAVLLGWQLAGGPPTAEALANELRVSSVLQGQVVAHLDALDTLADDPWLADHYEAVRTLEQLIQGIQAP